MVQPEYDATYTIEKQEVQLSATSPEGESPTMRDRYLETDPSLITYSPVATINA